MKQSMLDHLQDSLHVFCVARHGIIIPIEVLELSLAVHQSHWVG